MAGGGPILRILLLLHAQAQSSELECHLCARCYSTSVVLHGPESFSESVTPSHIIRVTTESILNLSNTVQDVKAQAVQLSNAYCKKSTASGLE